MVKSTTQDLEDHLEDINEKLQALQPSKDTNDTAVNEDDLRRMYNEKDSTERCLNICAGVLAHIDNMQLLPVQPNDAAAPPWSQPGGPVVGEMTQAHIVTYAVLRDCSDKLNGAVAELQAQKAKLDAQHAASAKSITSPSDTEVEARRLRGELDSTRQRLVVCNDLSKRITADNVHVVEDMHIQHDGKQLFVSDVGDLFNIRNVSAGDRAIQIVGSIPTEALQLLIKAHPQP